MIAFINDTGIAVVLGLLFLLFGASRIPQLARSLGEAGKEFKRGHDDLEAEHVVTVRPSPQPAPVEPIGAGAGRAAPAAEPVVTLTRAQLDQLMARSPSAGPVDVTDQKS